MTPLSEFLSLIQFEIQKSFDFSEQLMHELGEDQNHQLQLAIDTIDLDLPVLFELGEAEIAEEPDEPDKSALDNRKAGLAITRLDAPFLGPRTAAVVRAQIAGEPQRAPKVSAAKSTNAERTKASRKPSETSVVEDDRAMTLRVRTLDTPKTISDEDGENSGGGGLSHGRIRVQLRPVLK